VLVTRGPAQLSWFLFCDHPNSSFLIVVVCLIPGQSRRGLRQVFSDAVVYLGTCVWEWACPRAGARGRASGAHPLERADICAGIVSRVRGRPPAAPLRSLTRNRPRESQSKNSVSNDPPVEYAQKSRTSSLASKPVRSPPSS
jgi:hypothetical protein